MLKSAEQVYLVLTVMYEWLIQIFVVDSFVDWACIKKKYSFYHKQKKDFSKQCRIAELVRMSQLWWESLVPKYSHPIYQKLCWSEHSFNTVASGRCTWWNLQGLTRLFSVPTGTAALGARCWSLWCSGTGSGWLDRSLPGLPPTSSPSSAWPPTSSPP